MFRKIDRWIGRRMNVRRWIVVYYVIGVNGGGLQRYGLELDLLWVSLLGVVLSLVGLLGIYGHAMRLK